MDEVFILSGPMDGRSAHIDRLMAERTLGMCVKYQGQYLHHQYDGTGYQYTGPCPDDHPDICDVYWAGHQCTTFGDHEQHVCCCGEVQ